MNDYSSDREGVRSSAAQTSFPVDEVVSLKPLTRLLSKYRRVIGIAMAGSLILGSSLLLLLAILLPVERSGSIQVRLLFDGAADGRYPNGTTFSPAEIVATPVLAEVYAANDLQRFGKYQAFKESMAVLRTSLAHDLLASAYQSRLADPKLTPVDRARIEDEFRKKLDAITDPIYTLTIRRNERLRTMPTDVMEKVLNDTLVGWAKQADELKGVTRFNVPVFSASVLKPDLLDKDYLVAADGLRVQAKRAEDLTKQLMALPGASSIRSAKDQASLSDVRFALADILRNQIDPAIHMIIERGVTSDSRAMAQYLKARADDLRVERDSWRARIQALQDGLQGYMVSGSRQRETPTEPRTTPPNPPQGLDTQTLIPQINDTFLDRLIAMSSQTQAREVEYRQRLTERIIKDGEALVDLDQAAAYYDTLNKLPRSGGADTAVGAAMKAQLKGAYDSLTATLTKLLTLYDEVSAQRLNPEATLYAVQDPFTVRTQRALTSGTVVLVLSAFLMMALVGTPIACAVHQSYVRKNKTPRAA